MSDSMSTRARPGVVTRAKNANQRPGKILTNGRRTRRSPAQMAADKKVSEETAAVATVKNADVTATKVAPAERIIQREDVHLGKRRRASAESGSQCLSVEQAVRVGKRAKPPQDSTVAGPQMFDIVSIAQAIVAELVLRQQRVARDSFLNIEVQSYAFRSYPHENSCPHFTYQAPDIREVATSEPLRTSPHLYWRGSPRPTTTCNLPPSVIVVIPDIDGDEGHLSAPSNGADNALEVQRDYPTCITS